MATVVLLIVAYRAAFRLVDVGTGSAVPTQLIIVPMLFLLPLGLVPLAVAAGIVFASLTEHARGTIHVERVLMRVVNAWHAVGPALVLALMADRGPRLGDWPIYVLALGAQFAFDLASTSVREWAVLGVLSRVHLGAMASVYTIDAGLAPVGLAVAFAAQRSPYGIVLAFPLIGLLSVFARERRLRIDNELELRDAYRGTALFARRRGRGRRRLYREPQPRRRRAHAARQQQAGILGAPAA